VSAEPGAGQGHEHPVLDIKAPSRVTAELRKALRIPKNGTLVEFVLRDDVPNPQPDKLASVLSGFYMLRMINSSPHREVTLVTIGRNGISERQLSYQFPKVEIKERFEQPMTTDLGTQVIVEGVIGVTDEDLTQGEAAYTDREGGLLVLDEDDAVLDLQLFGFDDDPAARKLSGTIKLNGAGQYIRAKLNQHDPEEVLTETRDGFTREHPFYRQLRTILHPKLEPIVAKLRELGPKPKVTLSDKTRERHHEALDILNRLASQMLGTAARVPVIPIQKRTPPVAGIAFVNSRLSVQAGLTTPAALLINASMVGLNEVIHISSNVPEMVAEPAIIIRGEDPIGTDAIIKIVRVSCNVPDMVAKITARWRDVETTMEVTTTAREVLTPVDGLEFERDEYNVRINASRHLRLFVDVEKVPVGSEILTTAEGAALEVAVPRIIVEQENLITPQIAQLQILTRGVRPKKDIVVTASQAEFVAGTSVFFWAFLTACLASAGGR
jgi:hypothetical protein